MAFDGLDPFASEDNPAPIPGVLGEEIDVSHYRVPLSRSRRVVIEITDGRETINAHMTLHSAQRLIEELQAAIGAA